MKKKNNHIRKIKARFHAKRRFEERYPGFTINSHDIKDIKTNIQKGKCHTIFRISEYRTIKTCVFKGIDIYFIWNKSCEEILTFLTKEMVDNTIQKEGGEQYEVN